MKITAKIVGVGNLANELRLSLGVGQYDHTAVFARVQEGQEVILDIPELATEEQGPFSTRGVPANGQVMVLLREARGRVEEAITLQAKQLGETGKVVDLVGILDEIDHHLIGKP